MSAKPVTVFVELEDFGEEELIDECRERGISMRGDADPDDEQYVERAMRDLKELPRVPQSVLDLLWYVHGKALA